MWENSFLKSYFAKNMKIQHLVLDAAPGYSSAHSGYEFDLMVVQW